jgi:tRNA modification GTPase
VQPTAAMEPVLTAHPTIYALSSGRGRAGVAVIRISGAAAGLVLDQMAGPRPQPRYAAFRRVRHPGTGQVLDEALVLWLPAPRSETGEDMAELQVHGGAAVIRSVLSAIATVPGCRLAEPGAFVRRAFENGRLDLTAVEGIADLIDAETEAQRRQAVAHASGTIGKMYEGWRDRLLDARALIEAAIDFSDEGDVAANALEQGRGVVAELLGQVRGALADGRRGEIVRDGLQVVLAGPPNVGKSSLLNALARRDVAIVSEEAGTTRDVIEVRLDLGGYAIVVADTAGLRETSGSVEVEGMRRTLARAKQADVIVWVVDATTPQWRVPVEVASGSARLLTVLNKVDLCDAAPPPNAPVLAISAATGRGMDELLAQLEASAASLADAHGDAPALITQERHRQLLERAERALARCLDSPANPPELQAEDLRFAADALGQIIGRVDVEEVLGRIFGRFCIGK